MNSGGMSDTNNNTGGGGDSSSSGKSERVDRTRESREREEETDGRSSNEEAGDKDVVVVVPSTTHTRTISMEDAEEKEEENGERKSNKENKRKRSRSRSTSRSSHSRSSERGERDERKRKQKKRQSRSKSPKRKSIKRSRKDRRSSSSSSRGTFEGFDIPMMQPEEPEPEDDSPFKCTECGRGKLYSIKEVAEHEIRAHDAKIPCAHCDKISESVTKLAAHMLYRHPSDQLICFYCNEDFGAPADRVANEAWESFRKHVYQEVLKKKMYVHASKASNGSNAVALRGVGRCPHGPPVKCKNFPTCPGERCIYAHGQCRFDRTCNKSTCPFDHSNKPRTCMACLNDLKNGKLSSKGDRDRRY